MNKLRLVPIFLVVLVLVQGCSWARPVSVVPEPLEPVPCPPAAPRPSPIEPLPNDMDEYALARWLPEIYRWIIDATAKFEHDERALATCEQRQRDAAQTTEET